VVDDILQMLLHKADSYYIETGDFPIGLRKIKGLFIAIGRHSSSEVMHGDKFALTGSTDTFMGMGIIITVSYSVVALRDKQSAPELGR
jgi:hypothetical protein